MPQGKPLGFGKSLADAAKEKEALGKPKKKVGF